MLLHNHGEKEKGDSLSRETGKQAVIGKRKSACGFWKCNTWKVGQTSNHFNSRVVFVDEWIHVGPVGVKCELFLHLGDQTVNHQWVLRGTN